MTRKQRNLQWFQIKRDDKLTTLQIKIKLLKLGKTQADIVNVLLSEGFKIDAFAMSKYVNGKIKTPKAEKVMSRVYQLLEEWEEVENNEIS